MSIITKIKEKFSGGSEVHKFVFPIMIATIVLIGMVCLMEWYANWRGTHEYQSPVVFRLPWYEVEPTLISPISEITVKTKEKTMEDYRLAPVLETIYFLESTSGQNDGCKDEGKFNGFGYRQHNSEWKCYDTFGEVVEVVNIWFEERLSVNGNNIMEAVCLYNTGIPNQMTCEYGQNFLGVIVNKL